MNPSLIAAIVWVLVGSFCAMLPMRYQRWIGGPLLLAVPVLIYWLYRDFGFWIVVVAVLAFLSMFRYPLRLLYRKVRGLPTDLPPELPRGGQG